MSIVSTDSAPEILCDEPVGLSDPKYSQTRRRMLEIANKLHSTGVQLDMDLPQIAVIGSQSVGKSSLIESISGITLPRASGTCTRCPTECRLVSSTKPWACEVHLRFMTDECGLPLQQVKNIRFGPVIRDKSEVEQRLRRAQRAILNPRKDWQTYLEGAGDDGDELTFSSNIVSLQIEGPDVTDLSFCDLPGVIASVGEKGNVQDIDLVKELVVSHIEKKSCLVLLAVSCETDFENQGALRLAKECDPLGNRTIGVLTKVDRIEAGNEGQWVSILKNEQERLLHGWFAVKQPDPSELQKGISREEARKREGAHFLKSGPWPYVDGHLRQRLGSERLTHHLSTLLSDLISKRLPEMDKELRYRLDKTEKALNDLPPPPSKDPVREVIRLISFFNTETSKLFEGTPRKGGLIQSIRIAQEKFRNEIRQSSPDFRPYKELFGTTNRLTIPFLSSEEGQYPGSEKGSFSTVDLEDVMEKAQHARTRELPGHYPFVVRKELIMDFMQRWKDPALELCNAIERIVSSQIKDLIEFIFQNQAHGGLQQAILNIVIVQLKTCRDNCWAKIAWILDLERRPFTLNTHYLADYKDKFLQFYRAQRQRRGAHEKLISNLTNPSSASPIRTESRQATSLVYASVLDSTIASLANLGLHGVKPVDLTKLLPVDAMDEGLEIMAEVHAYYQVSYKRFIDYVPLTIDHEMLGGLEKSLERVLYEGLPLSGNHARECCERFLSQAPDVMSLRSELESRKERLEAARDEMAKMWAC